MMHLFIWICNQLFPLLDANYFNIPIWADTIVTIFVIALSIFVAIDIINETESPKQGESNDK